MAKKEKPDREFLSPPEISELEIAWDLFVLMDNNTGTIADLARTRGTSKDTIYRALDKVEHWVDRTLVHRSKGHHATLAEDCYLVIAPIGEIVQRYRQLVPQKFRTRIHIDSGMSLFIGSLTGVFNEFRQAYPDVDISLHYDQPSALRSRARAGECDLSVVSVHPNIKYPDATHSLFEFRMAVIGPHNHLFISACRNSPDEFPWVALHGETVAFIRNRVPELPYPQELIGNTNIHRVYFDTYAILHAMVAAGGAITFSLPQLLSEEQHDLLDVIDYPDAQSVRMALIRPANIKRPRSNADKQCISDLEKLLKDRLQELATLNPAVHSLSNQFTAFFVVLDKSGLLKWLSSSLSVRIQPSGRFGGLLTLLDDESTYDIRGVVQQSTKTRQVSVMFEGKRKDDVFSASFILRCLDDLKKPLVGTWHGHQTVDREVSSVLVPSAGYSVLIPGKEFQTNVKRLNKIVEEFNGLLSNPFSFPLPK